MDGPVENVQVDFQPGSGGRCVYCGSPLNAEYYFCLTCATPYRHVNMPLPRPGEVTLDARRTISRRAPHVWPLFWSYLAVVLTSGLVSVMLFGEQRADLSLLLGSVAVLSITLIFAARHWQSLVVQFRRVGFDRWQAWAGVLALWPLLLFNHYYHHWMMQQGDMPDVSPMSGLRHLGQPMLIVLVCVLPAVLEEIAFRGLIQHWLQVAMRPVGAVALASALFAALHFSVISWPYIFVVGMLLGWTKYSTGSLYPPMVIHLLHNLVVLQWFWR